MYADSRKIHIIETLLKVEDDAILREIETVLSKAKNKDMPARSFIHFTESLTQEEATEWETLIEEGCEKINEDDWK